MDSRRFITAFGYPYHLGELIAGVMLGPAVFGWVHPNEPIEILAQMGISFLMLHTGVTTDQWNFSKRCAVPYGSP